MTTNDAEPVTLEVGASPSADEPGETPRALTMEERQTQLEEAMRAVARLQILTVGSSVPPPPPRHSVPVEAAIAGAKKTAIATRIGFAVIGAVFCAFEWVAASYPHAIGPLGAAFKIGLRLLGYDAAAP